MPVAAIIGERIFCCHGGIVKDLDSLSDIADISRPMKTPNENAVMSQLTWNDPNRDSDGWVDSSRGVGFMFGKTPVRIRLYLPVYSESLSQNLKFPSRFPKLGTLTC